MSILEIAQENGIELEGSCEGSMACSTCHVIIDPSWYGKLENASWDEDDMLDLTSGLTLTSRLGCQIVLTNKLDGLIVSLPEAQSDIRLKKVTIEVFMAKFYRTSNEKLFNIPDFPYEDKYINNIKGFDDYKDIRMAYVDEGDNNSELTFLMLHGSPTWSYLWRHFIKEIVDANYRAVALDMIGFGRSDKPLDEKAYTFESMRSSIINAIEQLDLKNVVLVVHEWGVFWVLPFLWKLEIE